MTVIDLCSKRQSTKAKLFFPSKVKDYANSMQLIDRILSAPMIYIYMQNGPSSYSIYKRQQLNASSISIQFGMSTFENIMNPVSTQFTYIWLYKYNKGPMGHEALLTVLCRSPHPHHPGVLTPSLNLEYNKHLDRKHNVSNLWAHYMQCTEWLHLVSIDLNGSTY